MSLQIEQASIQLLLKMKLMILREYLSHGKKNTGRMKGKLAMIKIDKKNNVGIIALNKSLYPKHLVLQAKKDFSEVATISINKGQIELSPIDNSSIDVMCREFCNYLLGLVSEEMSV